ncbi:TNF receptor-associated factor 2-like [Lepisosteus oculatus]|uniref:TNF receptor-associated factor 2-like n=1 Tax=Lepisosteus oculatus TaxID=7918 RepID=UPI0035F52984
MVAQVSGLSPLDGSGSGLLCSACGFLLVRPRQTLCGHRYCAACVRALLGKAGSAACQICQEPIQQSKVFPDRAAENDASYIPVRCPNAQDGCDWSGPLQDYLSSHYGQCDHREEPCTNSNLGCWFSGDRAALRWHESLQCEWRVVPCPHCQLAQAWTLLQDHLQCCPQRPGQSAQPALKARGTGEQVPSDAGSLEEGSLCPFHAVGCDAKPARLPEHLRAAAPEHLALLLAFSLALGARLGRGEEVNSAFKRLAMARLLGLAPAPPPPPAPAPAAGACEDASTLRQLVGVLSEDLAACHRAIEALRARCERYDRLLRAPPPPPPPPHRHPGPETWETPPPASPLLPPPPLPVASHNGVLIWKVERFSEHFRAASSSPPAARRPYSLTSPPFQTGPFGYRLCCRLYPQGDGAGRGTHLSLFLCLLRGDFDDVLPWPFAQRVSFSLLAAGARGGRPLREAFLPDPRSGSFQRPRQAANAASGCPLFASLALLGLGAGGAGGASPYLRNDTLYIKVEVGAGSTA